MIGYLIKITDRLLETEAQSKVPDRSLFWSEGAAVNYRNSLMAEPIKFHHSQIDVFKVDIQILDEVKCENKESE